MTRLTRRLWVLWGLSAMTLGGYFGSSLVGEDRGIFLPGETTDGHYQIEIACDACHTSPFSSREEIQAACEGCHLEALEEARDSHPKSKFTDPRNADRVSLLDARYCVTCHVEHHPERTRAMGLTIPEDYCGLCHREIGEERPTHAGMSFESCASAGCHNFHDNRALYEDFLLRHADAPALLPSRQLPARNFASIAGYLDHYPKASYPLRALAVTEADAPMGHGLAEVTSDWADTAHAASGVNCTACHGKGDAWEDRPGYASCRGCHVDESAGFARGRHGMRLDREHLGRPLPPMTPAEARLPMKADAAAIELGCGSCHAPHRFDTQYAAIDACLGCHDDAHSRAYRESPHFDLVRRERAGELAAGSGVTCASCHMPRTDRSYDWGAYVHVLVQHNQSDNLAPNDKMIRSVCMSCHGLGFSIDSLADRALIRSNFAGNPSVHVESIDLALARRRAIEQERQPTTQ